MFTNKGVSVAVKGLSKQYHMAAEDVHALRESSWEVSGGEQERVAGAIALGNAPSLTLADEPTGNLDRTNATVIARLLRSLATDYGKTVVMVSHDPKTVEVFPEGHSMRDGRFVDA